LNLRLKNLTEASCGKHQDGVNNKLRISNMFYVAREL